ncbi:MAG TPA: hypothetical protein VLV50_04245 [Stellaceae bacterium]|nr:hypothetical protein [Stellaceae bacterium]
MNRRILLATTALAAGAFFGAPAHATGTPLSCSDSKTSDQSAVATAITTASSASGIIQITGICAGDYKITASPLTFINSGGTNSVSATDGFDGMVEILGAHVTFNGLTLKGTTLNASNGSNALSSSTFTEEGNLILHDGAVALIENSQIGPGEQDGLVAIRLSVANVLNTTISGNGTRTGSSAIFTSGIWVTDGSTLRLGNPDDSEPATVQGNGQYVANTSCSGFNILLTQSASANIFGSTIGGTTSGTGANCGEINLQAASSARMQDITLGHFGGLGRQAAIYAIGGSSVWIDENLGAASPTGSLLTEVADSVPNSIGLIFAGGASSVVLQDTTATGPSSLGPMVEASASSTIVLAGGNNVTNTVSGGIAIQVDHSSSMLQLLGRQFGFANEPDNVSGGGSVQEQSSMDLGQGLFGGLTSMNWVTGGSGIAVLQNSSFRLSGGVAITGAVTLQQGSNGFLNLANGGSAAQQTVSGGISCPFTAVPGSHVSAPTKVTPNPTMATSFGSAISPQCLQF